MAMMWAVPMASAGVRTTAVLGRLAKRGEGGGLEGQKQGVLGLDWAEFGVLARG